MPTNHSGTKAMNAQRKALTRVEVQRKADGVDNQPRGEEVGDRAGEAHDAGSDEVTGAVAPPPGAVPAAGIGEPTDDEEHRHHL